MRKGRLSIEQIASIKAFQNTQIDTQEKIHSIAKVNYYKKGQILFFEKDQVNLFYVILSGKVSMSRYSGWGQKRIFFILGEGELINEVVFDDLPISVVCEIFEDAAILQFRKEDFLDIMKQDFDLTLSIINSIGKKQRRLYRQLKNTVPIKMDKKLAAKLWKLSRDYGIRKDGWIQINLQITVTYLSYMLGSSRETISRAMTTLIEAGIVKWEGKRLFVREEELLVYYRNP